MGRIAEALRKAQTEKAGRSTLGIGPAWAQAGLAAEAGEPGLDAHRPGRRSMGFKSERSAPVIDPPDQASDVHMPPPFWDVHPTIMTVRERSSPITEQYRAARTWLLRRSAPSGKNCVAVTSSVAREGKSVTTANLAAIMAEVRHMKVLAIDCDIRQGSLARLFRISNEPGISEVMAGRATLASAIQTTPLGNLFVLPAGECHDINSTELLNSTAASTMFAQIRDRFDYVLVDTPPVQCLSDVGVIGALCTGLILVVRMNKTPAHLVRQSAHWLQANNLNILGCIAADCSARGARYEYDVNGGD
ncbi:MAG TPA: CpsD/CapB family tyrosine-protein kinase [Phycisphaerae bacterium]|nr:CpsD/CapB family tyrosine-protein kinase [Phycisphaerae bacterium]